MNTTTIVLGTILIIIIVFMLFQDYFTGKTKLEKQQHLLKSSPPAIDSSKLASPGAVNFTYTIWVFVNSTNSGDKDDSTKMTIFKRSGDTHLYLNKSSGTLIADMGTGGETIHITNNFPLQKWVCVTISVNQKIMDAYIDGKIFNKRNPITNKRGRCQSESFENLFNKKTSNSILFNTKDKPLANLFNASFGVLLAYILFRVLKKEI